MKLKIYLLVLIQLSAILLFSFAKPQTAGAVNLSAGVSIWYVWWEPTWLDSLKNPSDTTDSIDLKFSPEFMAGPAISIKLTPEINLSSVFMYSSLFKVEKTTNNNRGTFFDTTDDYTAKETLEITKYDLDTTLSYALNETFKIFAGIKYQGYNYDDVYYDISSGVVSTPISFKIKTKSTGPGIGMGITYPLINNFYLLANVSGIYMYNTTTMPYIKKQSYDITGYSGSVSLSWYKESWSTTFSLGGRYQYLHYKNRSDGIYNPLSPTEDDPFDGKADKFYGLTFTSTYNFSI